MAITSYGFGVDSTNTEGEIGVLQWAQMASYLGAEYTVLAPGAPGALEGLAAYLPNSGDRRIDIRPGAAVAHGTFSISDSTIPLTLPASPSGDRWYIVGLRRNWATFGTNVTMAILGYGSTVAAALNTLNRTPGVLDDQPLWAARVSAGSSGIGATEDLRLWGSGSQLVARSIEVLNYAKRRGTQIYIDDVSWTRVVDSSGVESWTDNRGGRILDSIPGAWAPLSPPGNGDPGVRVWASSPQDIASISIPDQGRPYRVQMHFQAFIGNEGGGGTRFDFAFYVGPNLITAYVPQGGLSFADWKDYITLPSAEIFTGAQTARVVANRVVGSEYGAIRINQGRGIRAVTYGA